MISLEPSLKNHFLRIRIQDSMRAPSGTLPSLVKPSNQTQGRAPRGGPRTMVFAQNTVNYKCFNDFKIFFFSINTFHNHHPSLNACVSNFIFWVVLSRYLAFNAPPKVVISLGTSQKYHFRTFRTYGRVKLASGTVSSRMKTSNEIREAAPRGDHEP